MGDLQVVARLVQPAARDGARRDEPFRALHLRREPLHAAPHLRVASVVGGRCEHGQHLALLNPGPDGGRATVGLGRRNPRHRRAHLEEGPVGRNDLRRSPHRALDLTYRDGLHVEWDHPLLLLQEGDRSTSRLFALNPGGFGDRSVDLDLG
jgi:hypothetical protein